MSMYCMQCSALGVAPLTVACSCGSVRWRGTYELPGEPFGSGKNVFVVNNASAVVKAERDQSGNLTVTVSNDADAGERRTLALVDAIRKMIAQGGHPLARRD